MQAKKQKNGKWRAQLSVIEIENGKKVTRNRSFTADTKADAEFMALQYKKTRTGRAEDVRVCEAVRRYIDSKSNVLSPATVRGYWSDARRVIGPLYDVKLSDLTTETVQLWVNDAAERLSPKTVKNAHGLLVSSVKYIMPSWGVRVTLPKIPRKEFYIPSLDEVRQLIETAPTDNLRKAIELSAYGSLRRGEICALTKDDILDGWISVTKDSVRTMSGQYVVKDMPKTIESYRRTPVPDEVIEDLRGGLVTCTPMSLSLSFAKHVKASGMPHIRFHDLRHFFASYLHLKGVPDAYIEKFGGWKAGSSVMKEIYRNTINKEEQRQADYIKGLFAK